MNIIGLNPAHPTDLVQCGKDIGVRKQESLPGESSASETLWHRIIQWGKVFLWVRYIPLCLLEKPRESSGQRRSCISVPTPNLWQWHYHITLRTLISHSVIYRDMYERWGWVSSSKFFLIPVTTGRFVCPSWFVVHKPWCPSIGRSSVLLRRKTQI